jgi:hypothetical protein
MKIGFVAYRVMRSKESSEGTKLMADLRHHGRCSWWVWFNILAGKMCDHHIEIKIAVTVASHLIGRLVS